MTYEKAQNEKGKFSAAWVKTLGNKIANLYYKRAKELKNTRYLKFLTHPMF
jgi:hypothetical protein